MLCYGFFVVVMPSVSCSSCYAGCGIISVMLSVNILCSGIVLVCCGLVLFSVMLGVFMTCVYVCVASFEC